MGIGGLTLCCGVYFLAVNLVAFVLYAVDKSRARRHRWRIPEATLLGVAFLGGFIGAALGMVVCHHKTRKWRFRLGVPAAVLLWCGLAYFLFLQIC